MLITRRLHPDAVQDCLNIHCASDYDPTFEDCSSFLRLLVAGYENEDLDTIPTVDLQGLALVATRNRATPKPCLTQDCKNWGQERFGGRCYFHRPAEKDADGFYIRTEPIGEPERDRGCDEMPGGGAPVSAHTPGPWKFFEVDGAYRVNPEAGGYVVAVLDCLAPFSPEAEANARLISAAPDLLETLKGIMAQVDGFVSNWDELPEGCAAIESAHAAIAKAQGERK
jgi:hypothetical protein